MPELNEICKKLVEKLSEKADIRRLVVAALAEAFLSEITDTKKIQNAQNKLKKNVNDLIKDLGKISNYISENVPENISDYDIKYAKRLVKEELALFIVLRDEFFKTSGLLPMWGIDMQTVRERLEVDKIVETVSKLNILVGNVKNVISEITLLSDLKTKAKAA